MKKIASKTLGLFVFFIGMWISVQMASFRDFSESMLIIVAGFFMSLAAGYFFYDMNSVHDNT